MALYITVTIAVTEWRTSFRKEMIDLDNGRTWLSLDVWWCSTATNMVPLPQLPALRRWTRYSTLKPSNTFRTKITKSAATTKP